jgi:Globin
MTPQQIKLVQTSFASVRSITDTAAALFYGRLFELDPSLQCLFHGNMRAQGRKLMAMLEYIVAGLHRPETIMPAVQELGRRHADYGVRHITPPSARRCYGCCARGWVRSALPLSKRRGLRPTPCWQIRCDASGRSGKRLWG